MQRNLYLDLRRRGDWMSIAYHHYKEHGRNLPPDVFLQILTIGEFDVEGFLVEQDVKHRIVITTFKDKIIDIK